MKEEIILKNFESNSKIRKNSNQKSTQYMLNNLAILLKVKEINSILKKLKTLLLEIRNSITIHIKKTIAKLI